MNPGDPAPDVTATTAAGEAFVLADVLAEHEVIFYFFPKSFTPL